MTGTERPIWSMERGYHAAVADRVIGPFATEREAEIALDAALAREARKEARTRAIDRASERIAEADSPFENRARVDRAVALRREMRGNHRLFVQVLSSPPKEMAHWTLLEMLLAVRGGGRRTMRYPQMRALGRRAVTAGVNLLTPLGEASATDRAWVAQHGLTYVKMSPAVRAEVLELLRAGATSAEIVRTYRLSKDQVRGLRASLDRATRHG